MKKSEWLGSIGSSRMTGKTLKGVRLLLRVVAVLEKAEGFVFVSSRYRRHLAIDGFQNKEDLLMIAYNRIKSGETARRTHNGQRPGQFAVEMQVPGAGGEMNYLKVIFRCRNGTEDVSLPKLMRTRRYEFRKKFVVHLSYHPNK